MKRKKILVFLVLLSLVNSNLFSKDIHDATEQMINLSWVKNNQDALSSDFLLRLKKIFNIDVFIETGTAEGYTTRSAIGIFDKVHSIELGNYFYTRALQAFDGESNLKLHLGDSADVLRAILPRISGKKCFWLDAHYSGGLTVRGKENTPIMRELDVLKQCGVIDSVVLIDDIRCFHDNYFSSPILDGYPTLTEIENKLKEINPLYKLAVIGDVALAYCVDEKVSVSPLIKACTMSRLFDDPRSNIQDDILKSEKIIAAASDEEFAVIDKLCNRFENSLELGLHYRLWRGLMLLERKRYLEAQREFQIVRSRLYHSRIDDYLAQAKNFVG